MGIAPGSPLGRGFENNVLLRAFHQGVMRRDELGSLAGRTSDRFDEETLRRFRPAVDDSPGAATGSSTGQSCEEAKESESRINVPSQKRRRGISPKTFAGSFAPTQTSSLVMPSWNCWSPASQLG